MKNKLDADRLQRVSDLLKELRRYTWAFEYWTFVEIVLRQRLKVG